MVCLFIHMHASNGGSNIFYTFEVCGQNHRVLRQSGSILCHEDTKRTFMKFKEGVLIFYLFFRMVRHFDTSIAFVISAFLVFSYVTTQQLLRFSVWYRPPWFSSFDLIPTILDWLIVLSSVIFQWCYDRIRILNSV